MRIPTHRPPTHPGEMLLEEFLKPMGITQVELARKLKIPFQRVNQIVRGKRSVTPDTALRLAKVLGTSVEQIVGSNGSNSKNNGPGDAHVSMSDLEARLVQDGC